MKRTSNEGLFEDETASDILGFSFSGSLRGRSYRTECDEEDGLHDEVVLNEHAVIASFDSDAMNALVNTMETTEERKSSDDDHRSYLVDVTERL
jgi:hypothetical protein